MQKHVQNRLIKCGGSCSEPGHSRGRHNPQAFSALLRPVFHLSSFRSKDKNAKCAKYNRVGVFSQTIRVPDASCWAKEVLLTANLFEAKLFRHYWRISRTSLMERKTSVAVQAAHTISNIFTGFEIYWRTYLVRCYLSLVFLRISNNFPNMRWNQSDLIKLKSWLDVLNV